MTPWVAIPFSIYAIVMMIFALYCIVDGCMKEEGVEFLEVFLGVGAAFAAFYCLMVVWRTYWL